MPVLSASSRLPVFAVTLLCFFNNAWAQPNPRGAELPKSAQIPGATPDVLLRAGVPGAPGKILIFTHTTYKLGAHVAWHRHNSQIVWYILQGRMSVQDRGAAPFLLKPGDSLLIKPGTVHQHWNASASEPLVFWDMCFNDGQPSAVFLK